MTPNYYAVIFSSKRTNDDFVEYQQATKAMVTMAADQKGYLGMESYRNPDGAGVTISYWASLEDIKTWRSNSDHLLAQKMGRTKWYESFKVRICRVEREYGIPV